MIRQTNDRRKYQIYCHQSKLLKMWTVINEYLCVKLGHFINFIILYLQIQGKNFYSIMVNFMILMLLSCTPCLNRLYIYHPCYCSIGLSDGPSLRPLLSFV